MRKSLLAVAAVLAATAMGQNKPYITRVYDIMPAPGQFVNVIPACSEGEPRDSVLARASRALCGTTTIEEGELPDGTVFTDTVVEARPGMVSLGSFGGYVVFGFDHPVVNVPGEYDMQIFGNAFGSDSLKNGGGGSCEPGIVMVSRDVNGNGLPDDPWYELAGSEYNNPRTQHHFTITYYKPDKDKTRIPHPTDPHIIDIEHIRWTSNSVDSLQEGYIPQNQYHLQSYWPLWAESDTLTFTGTKLRNNAVDVGGYGTYFMQNFFDWGYVDNRPDYYYNGEPPKSVQNMGFNIEWAVDDDGNPVSLPQIDFVKVYSALLQQCGWLGETSTEVGGAIDLHPDAVATFVVGDLDSDGIVDVTDMNIIINIILKKGDATAAVEALADLDGNGVVDVTDMNALINIILHKD